STGIVHLGVGNFHRSHQAMYIDTLMNSGAAMDWGICGIGLQPSSTRMRAAMAAQDGLYTLVIRHGDGSWEARVIGSIVEYLFAPDDPEAAIEKMASPTTRIVSLTITEGGYNLDAVTGEFNSADESVVADLRPGAMPRTVFGLVTEALARRRRRGIPAVSILSCDNVQGNGHVSQRAFTAFARLRDPELAEWMTSQVRFPNGMVDRITPQTTDADRAELSRRFGIDDAWPVLCEPFTQWVLEENFTDGQPPLEDVGVQIVSDVEPYELMKLRLLNASHQALCYPGYLVGYRLVHDVTTDPLFARFLLEYMTQEAIPTLRPVPGIDLQHYARELIERVSKFTRASTSIMTSIPEHGVRRTLADGGPRAGRPGEEVALTSMRRVVVYPGQIAVEAGDIPAPGPDEALVRTLVTGVGGSDQHAAHGRRPFVRLPYRPGHEFVGVIESVGSAVQERTPGQRVIVEPDLPCWTCKMCTSGRENLCENLQFFGCGYPQGGMADYFTLAANRLHPV